MKEKKDRVDDALSVTKAAVDEGDCNWVGGACLIKAGFLKFTLELEGRMSRFGSRIYPKGGNYRRLM